MDDLVAALLGARDLVVQDLAEWLYRTWLYGIWLYMYGTCDLAVHVQDLAVRDLTVWDLVVRGLTAITATPPTHPSTHIRCGARPGQARPGQARGFISSHTPTCSAQPPTHPPAQPRAAGDSQTRRYLRQNQRGCSVQKTKGGRVCNVSCIAIVIYGLHDECII